MSARGTPQDRKGLQVDRSETTGWTTGFANVLGVSSGSVHGDGLVNVFTAGERVMPMYAVQGCDYGLQTLADPATGTLRRPACRCCTRTTTPTPSGLTADTQVLTDSADADVDYLVKDSTGNKVRFTAGFWSNARKIGFFRSDAPLVPPIVQGSLNTFWQYGFPTPYLNATAEPVTRRAAPPPTLL